MTRPTMALGGGHDVRRREADHRRGWNALQGAAVVLAGSGVIVALAFGAMMTLTGPDGWITKAANTTVNGGEVVLTAFAEEGR